MAELLTFNYDLIISDNEMQIAADAVSTYEANLEETLKGYKKALDDLSANGIVSGQTHDAIVLFSQYAEDTCEMVTEIRKKYQTLKSDFISDIDGADSYLYDDGKRDFSEKEYQTLVKCLDNPWNKYTDKIGDWLLKGASGALKYLKKIPVVGVIISVVGFSLRTVLDQVTDALTRNKKILLDLEDETLVGLNGIFKSVYSIDQKYGPTDGSNSFHFFIGFYYDLTRFLNEMATVIHPSGNYFTPDGIKRRITPLFKSLKKSFDRAMAIPTSDIKLTSDEIIAFSKQIWATTYFSANAGPCMQFAYDRLGLKDAIVTTIFNMFDIARTQIKNKIMSLFDGGESSLFHSYEDYLMKEALLMQLTDMSGEEQYKDSVYHEILSEMKDALKGTNDSGEALYKYLNTTRQNWESTKKSSFQEGGGLLLDGRTKEAKDYKGFLESLDKAEKILKYGDQGLDYVARLLANYEKGLEMIDSLKRTHSGDEAVEKAIADIEALYKKQADAWVKEGLDIAVEDGLEIAEKALLKKAGPVGIVIGAIEDGIDVVGDATGLSNETAGLLDYATQLKLYSTQSTAYSVALEKLRACDPSSDEYETCVDDVKNCFNMTKRSLKGMYEAMAKASWGEERSYYLDCAKKVSEMSMRDAEKPVIMTYQEYLQG